MPVHDLRPLVARGAELEALASAVVDACVGRPVVLVVRGEAGIGKSRLVRELSDRPPGDELVVLRGDCFRVDAGELPFAPLAAALRDAGEEELEQALTAISPGAQRQLGTMFPHLFTVAEPAQRVDSDRHAERQQFDALLCLLGALAELRPRLLVIEDLHWADRSTRDFIGFLARSLRDERLATLITYRTHLPLEEDRAAQTIADLASRATLVDLIRLSDEAVAEHARNVIGPDARAPVVRSICRRAGGNPYFAEELLAAHLAGHGDEVPDAIATAALPRVARVPEDAQRVLRCVAGFQRPVSWSLLLEVCGLTPDALSRALRDALDHHLLTDDRGGDFAFRHDLIREAVYRRLHAGERIELHLAIAEGLAARGEGAHAELAFHWTEAGRPEKALPASVAAGMDAERARGFAAAAQHFATARRLWDQLGVEPAGVGFDRVDLLARLADACQGAGDYDGALEACERALEQPGLAPERASAFHERLGRLNSTDSEFALAQFRRALELAAPGDDPRRARLLAEEAYALWGLHRWEEACRRADEAIALATAAGASAERFYAQVVGGLAHAFANRRQEGERTLRAAVETPGDARADDRLRAYVNLGEVCRMQGRFEAAREAMDDGAELAAEIGLRNPFGTFMAANAASDLFLLARWAEADRRLDELRDVPLAHWTELLVLQVTAQLALARGELEAAAATLKRAKRLAVRAAPEYLPPVYAALAELALAGGDPGQARRELAEVKDRSELLYAPMLYAVAARVEADATAALAPGDATRAQRAEAARRQHEDLADLIAEAGEDPPPLALAHLAVCRAEALRAEAAVAGRAPSAAARRAADGATARVGGAPAAAADGASAPDRGALSAAARRSADGGAGADAPAWERAADAWAEAAAIWGALAAPHPRAYAHWRQAELLLEGRRRRQGLGTLQLAHDEAARIGARFLVERIAETHRHARGSVRVTESPKPAANPHGLTDRELDVLARMREGKANKAIAHELFISERTVTTHVGHVLMKLDVKNRTEAARVADRPDLAALLNGR